LFTSAVSETNLYVCQVPIDTIGLNGFVTIDILWKYTNANNVRTPSVRLNTTSGATSSGYQIFSTNDASSINSNRSHLRFANQNSKSVQSGTPTLLTYLQGNNAAARATGTINTAGGTTYLNINCSLTSGSDVCAMEAVTIILHQR